jgi:hypothetical protein
VRAASRHARLVGIVFQHTQDVRPNLRNELRANRADLPPQLLDIAAQRSDCGAPLPDQFLVLRQERAQRGERLQPLFQSRRHGEQQRRFERNHRFGPSSARVNPPAKCGRDHICLLILETVRVFDPRIVSVRTIRFFD